MPTQALDEPSLALSMTGTTQAPLRQRARRRVTAIVAAAGSALLAIFALWFFLRPEPPRLRPRPRSGWTRCLPAPR